MSPLAEDLAGRIAAIVTIPNVEALCSLINDHRGRHEITFAEFAALRARCRTRINQLTEGVGL